MRKVQHGRNFFPLHRGGEGAMSWSYFWALEKSWRRKSGGKAARWDGQPGRGFSGGGGWRRDGAASPRSRTTTSQKPGARLGTTTLKMFLAAQSQEILLFQKRFWGCREIPDRSPRYAAPATPAVPGKLSTGHATAARAAGWKSSWWHVTSWS